MRILLTNDDGIDAPGIRALCQEFSQYADVFVVAPDSERSAASQSITVHHPIRVDVYDMDIALVSAWKVGGTPTDCVKLALEALMAAPPDIIISGINIGANLGTDVLYSGTVSAAIEGALHAIPSVAVSLDTSGNFDFAPAARVTGKLARKIVNNPAITQKILLNVNIPALPEDKIQDFAITKLGERFYENTFDRREDPRGRCYYWIGGKLKDSPNSADTDIAAVKAGKVSITPIHFDLTDYTLLALVEEWTR